MGRITQTELDFQFNIFAKQLGLRICKPGEPYPPNRELGGYAEIQGYNPSGFRPIYKVVSLSGVDLLGPYYHTKSELYYILLAANRAMHLQHEYLFEGKRRKERLMD